MAIVDPVSHKAIDIPTTTPSANASSTNPTKPATDATASSATANPVYEATNAKFRQQFAQILNPGAETDKVIQIHRRYSFSITFAFFVFFSH